MQIQPEQFQWEQHKLHYTLSPQEQPDKISMEMIQRNQKEIDFLLPMRFITENGYVTGLEYEGMTMRSLGQYLRDYAINRKKFLDIAQRLLHQLRRCSDYMLPLSQIALDAEHIYLDPATMQIGLLCIPVVQAEECVQLRELFLDLLERVYLDAGSFQETEVFQQIYDAVAEKGTDLSTLDRVLESFEESKPKNQAASQEPLHMPEQKPMQREQENMRQSDLVNVAQETRTVAAAAQSREKKSMLSGLFCSREGKSRQEHGSNLMAQLRGVQNGNGKAEPRLQQPVQPLVQASAAQRIQTNGQKNAPYGGTVLILHEEPEEKGFLICQLGKLPIDPEGSRIGRLHGATSQRITIFFDSSHVSSYHALLAYDFERNCFTVTDFSSTGVKHNGVRIPKETPIVLKDQDTLVFGDVACRVQLEQSGKQV